METSKGRSAETTPPISTTAETTFLLELDSLVSLMKAHAERVKRAGREWHEHESAARAGVRLSNERPGHGGAKATVGSTQLMIQRQGDVWVGIDGFLSAWARGSLILWPAPHFKSSDEHKTRAYARGEYLCEVLGITDDHMLYDRGLRNAWTHFDERLDDALYEYGRVRLQRFRRGTESDPGMSVTMRDVDLTNLTITVEGERHDLLELFAAAKDLGDRVNAASQSMATRRHAEILAEAEANSY